MSQKRLPMPQPKTYAQGLLDGLRPDTRLTVSEWSDQHRILPMKAAKEAGRWRTARTPYLKAIMDCLSPSSPVERVVFMKGAQVGGPLALDTPIPTVDGWTTMGAIKVGDWLFDEKGQPCRVQGVSPVMENRDCFIMHFDDGEQITCDAEHRWPVWDYTNETPVPKTLTTGNMLGRTRIGKGKRYRYAVDVCQPIALPERDLLIHPYVLGVWLGDGSSIMNHISVEEGDTEIADHLNACGVQAVYRLPVWRKGRCANIVINPGVSLQMEFEKAGTAASVAYHSSSFTQMLRMLDVLGNKHIPEEYLRASRSQRLALLQGLMDSDGSINPDGKRCEFSNTNRRIIDAVLELLRGLGYKVAVYKTRPKTKSYPNGRIYTSQPGWRLSWTAYSEEPMFRMSRKVARMRSIEKGLPARSKRRRIIGIEPAESVPVRCIEVSSPSHLYLCGRGWIPTHNTECGNNWLGYVIHHTPGPMMYVLPTLDMAKRTSKQRIAPMIEEMPILKERVKDSRSRDSGNTQLVKEFPNGVLIIAGANSATGLRSMPARFLFLDEVDAYDDDVDGEGSPINLAIKRTATFSRNRKILMVSTPNIAGSSKIETAYEQSNQQQYQVPCTKCGHFQPIEWPQIKFENDDPETASFECSVCQHRMKEHDKPRLLEQGKWVVLNEEADGKAAGFHLSSLYSPNGWYSWRDAVADFLAAKNDPVLLKDWTNTVLGQTWQEQGETVDHEFLYQRREHYVEEVPWSVEVLTCGVDVQDDRIEFEVVGWGAGEESWSIDYYRLYGDLSHPEIWKVIAEKLRQPFKREDGVMMNIAQVCMDSGGHFTDEVYAFSRKMGIDWLIPIKGASQAGKPIANFPKTRNKKGVYLTLVGTDTAKELIYQRYRALEPGPGYCHWPVKDCFDEDYFKQATAEEKVRKYRRGVAYFEWDAKKKRNEALDCRVYALTAVRILQQHRGLNLEQLAEQRPQPDSADVMAETVALIEQKPRPRRSSHSHYLQLSR